MKETLLTKLQREAREKFNREYVDMDNQQIWDGKRIESYVSEAIANTLKQAAESLEGMKIEEIGYAKNHKDTIEDIRRKEGYNQALTDAQKMLTGDSNENV